MEHVFDPDEEGSSSSRTVVLQGCAGVGKTAVVYKFMFDWAAGMVTPGLYDTNYTFLNHFLKKAEGGVNIYTFLHFSFQEFLTAVFYALKNDNSFSSLMIQFLFGLLHKAKGKSVETTFGRKISPGLREELLKWTDREIKDKTSRLQIEQVLSVPQFANVMSRLHLICQALRNPYCKIKDLSTVTGSEKWLGRCYALHLSGVTGSTSSVPICSLNLTLASSKRHLPV
ncbi:PREDICTED: NACHT, LRR and PYD domains-containing protein 12-like [Galeopterus variegatus]|uniref:NACHT, LRR and PYD domains-containing protein 12-like n=1 Tax=Galeopterus variegatus TaxID=482537 RepID=A0ABM0RJ67_GALVR|nr:PREDICTED: NACHT, LRR and PYD domains-containing protein 12-like [Galeopterus variegatus]